MNEANIAAAKELFREGHPDFVSFGNKEHSFYDDEIGYKREAAAAARRDLEPFVSGQRQLTGAEEARGIAFELFNLTNFLNWRDKQYLDDSLFTDESAWFDFMSRMLSCLRQTPDGAWREELSGLLEWIGQLGSAANITKLLPTYFLFLWDPEHHIFIKPQFFDRFLRLLGEEPTGGGQPLTVETYERVLAACDQVREALADWGARDNIDVHGFAWVVARQAKKQPEPKVTGGGTNGTADGASKRGGPAATSAIPLNLILAGPPGTGKTYRLLKEYVPLFEQAETEQSLEDFVFEQCGELKWHEVCVVALALLGKPAKVAELANSLPAKAKQTARGRTTSIKPTLWVCLQEYCADDCPNVKSSIRREPGLFWKEADSTWRLSDEATEAAGELIELAEQIRAYKPRKKTVRRCELVTFHQSYSYEDFVEGIKPLVSAEQGDGQEGQIEYDVVHGVFRRLVNRAVADPEHSYALFVDEINRANVSSVFGELITLLEPDKRMRYDRAKGQWVGGVRVKLPYTHSMKPAEPLFGVPENLHVIGTMNTADRSIALMDIALRRRFTFDEIMPEPGLLRGSPGPVKTDGKSIHLDRLLDAMNQRIEYLYDRDHTIGHSYLMNVRSLEDLEEVFRRAILPLLQEYFYGDWDKIQLVLADLSQDLDVDGRPKARPDAIVTHVVQKPMKLLGLADEAYQDRRSYAISEEFSPSSFQKIYEGLQG